MTLEVPYIKTGMNYVKDVIKSWRIGKEYLQRSLMSQ
jgi:hypothetical protein